MIFLENNMLKENNIITKSNFKIRKYVNLNDYLNNQYTEEQPKKIKKVK